MGALVRRLSARNGPDRAGCNPFAGVEPGGRGCGRGGLGSRHRAARKSQRGVPLGGVGPVGPFRTTGALRAHLGARTRGCAPAAAAAGWVPAPRPGACAAGRRRPGWAVVKLPLSARTLVLALWPRRRTSAATFVPACGVCFAHDRVQRKIRLEVCDLGD